MDRGFLLNGATASGYGVNAAGGGLVVSGYNQWQGMLAWNRVGAGSASATVFGSPDPDNLGWYPISSFPINGQGSAILSANYGYLRASVFWTAANPTAHLFAQWAG